MALSVEAAVVTKKGAAHPFNTDSVNAAGKVWPSEVVHSEKGVRVVGAHKGIPYYVLAGSETKGTAQSAADLFQKCVPEFKEDGSNCAVLISDYLNAFAKVLVESGYSSSDCSFAILAGFNDTVYIGKSGSSRAYTYYGSTFTEIDPEMKPFTDGNASYGVAQCSNVNVGDVFLLLSGKVAAVFPDGLLKAVCEKSEGDVKKIAGLISSQAAKYGYQEAVSAIVVKITDVEIPAAAPEEAETVPAASPENREPETEGGFAQTPEEIAAAIAAAADEKESPAAAADVPEPEEPVEPAKKGKRAGVIIFATLLALVVLAGVYFFVSGGSEKFFGTNVTTTEATSSETETESETESESLTADEPESTEEESSEEEATTEETTTEERTTRRETTTRSTTTTKAPETTEATTAEESTEEQEQEGTTEAPEVTTEDNNTESTTEKQEETNPEPDSEETADSTPASEETPSASGDAAEEEQP